MSPHTLTATWRPCPQCTATPCAECTDSPDVAYTLTCTGVTDECRAWTQCERCTSEDIAVLDDEEDDADGIAHGVQHADINGDWCRPMTICWLADVLDDLPYYAEQVTLQPGTFTVAPVFDAGDLEELALVHWVAPAANP
jgi:hypothetical protein